MKNTLVRITLAALAVVLLGSCEKINQRIDALEERIDGIETEKIASISSQIASINSSIADLGTIRSNVTSLRSQVDDHSTDIFNLEEADRALQDRILNLEDYLDDVLPTYAEKDWVKATFSTLEQYEATCDTIAKIDARIGKLDERLSKEIKACADSMKKWVNVQFEAYYTAAEMDAALEYMQAEIDSAKVSGKITDERVDSLAKELTTLKTAVDTAKANIRKEYRAAIDTAIKTSEGKLTKALQDEIAKVNADITALTTRVTNLEISVATLTGRIVALESMIQAVTIVPAYSDGSVKVENDTLYLDCCINPVTAVETIDTTNFKILLTKVLTKAVVLDTVPTDSIKVFTKDLNKGTISIQANIAKNIDELGDNESLAVAVNVKNGISHFTTEFVPVYVAPAPVVPEYVEIEADYDNNPDTPNTTLKWYRQNLAISDSGKKAWKGNNSSAVKVPGTDKDVIVGDYFQWAAYANYSPTSQSQDQGLLLYTSFDNKRCGDEKNQFYTDGGNFSKSFNIINAPYGDGGYSYLKYYSSSPAILERTTTANDDVANIILGDNWRMPTTAEFQAMRAVTYWAWDATDIGYYVFMPNQGTSGAANAIGIFNTSSDDKTKALLFFPAAGGGSNNTLNINDIYQNGYYWSSSLETDNIIKAYLLSISYRPSTKAVSVNPQLGDYRYSGYSVRPVKDAAPVQ